MASLYLIEVSNSHPSRRRKPPPWCPCPCWYRASGGGFAQAVWRASAGAQRAREWGRDPCGVVADGFRLVTMGHGVGAAARGPSAPVPGRTAPGRAAPAPAGRSRLRPYRFRLPADRSRPRLPGRTAPAPGRTAPAPRRTAPACGRIVPAHGRSTSGQGRTVPVHSRTAPASWRAVRPRLAGVAPGGAGTRGVAEQGAQQQERALFGEWFVPGTAFGRLDAGRAPGLALTTDNGFGRSGEPLPRYRESALGEPGSALVPVVNEHGQQAGGGMQVSGHAADIHAVTGREQGQQPDRGVFGGVRGPRQVHPRLQQHVPLARRDGPPDGAGAQRARRQVEDLLAVRLAGLWIAPGERGDLTYHLDLAEVHGTGPPCPPPLFGDHVDPGDLPGRRGITGVTRRHDRDTLVQV